MNRYEYGILETCQMLHLSATGASDPIPLEELILRMHFLLLRLETWGWGNSKVPGAVYDNLVERLASKVLEESLPILMKLLREQYPDKPVCTMCGDTGMAALAYHFEPCDCWRDI